MTKNKSKLKINRKACIGCGLCSSLDPETFFINQKDGKAEIEEDSLILESELNSKVKTKIITECIKACPVKAIYKE